MDRRYTIASECIELIQRSKASYSKKLELEAGLLRIKRLILADEAAGPGEEVFESLLLKARQLMETNADAALNSVTDEIRALLCSLQVMAVKPKANSGRGAVGVGVCNTTRSPLR